LVLSPTPAPTNTFAPIPPTPLPDFEQLANIFEYDRSAELGLKWGSESQQGEAILHHITFIGSDDCLIRAYLVTPKSAGQFPAVMYMHMGSATKDQYLEEAQLLAGKGVISLLFDSPFRRGCGDSENPRQGYIRTVIDVRRAVDLLETTSEVDATRIGYVGHSFGATWGGVLAGVEARIKAFVLMAGYAQVSQHDSPEVPDLDAILYIGHAQGAAFLFQFSTNEHYFSIEEANQYFDAAPEPKVIFWYDSTHAGLQDAGQEDRLIWLGEQLDFTYP
jgi:dienelactone hydrolase